MQKVYCWAYVHQMISPAVYKLRDKVDLFNQKQDVVLIRLHFLSTVINYINVTNILTVIQDSLLKANQHFQDL